MIRIILVEEMTDAMQCLFSIYIDVCDKADFSISEVFDEITIKNKKLREKAPLYTKNLK
jgi:division protein CdvB (Snf7/Vps24/ESCRT-III family)